MAATISLVERLFLVISFGLSLCERFVVLSQTALYHLLVCWRNARRLLQLLLKGTRTWIVMLGRLLVFTAVLAPGWYRLLRYWFTSPFILRNVPYGQQGQRMRHLLDVYMPCSLRTHHQDRGVPVVVFVSGGAWMIGYKLWSAMVGRGLAALGLLVFVPDYRNFPQGDVQDMIEDVSLAVKWGKENARRFGGDGERLVLAGQSAGAHISLCALVADYLRAKERSSPAATATATASFVVESRRNETQEGALLVPRHVPCDSTPTGKTLEMTSSRISFDDLKALCESEKAFERSREVRFSLRMQDRDDQESQSSSSRRADESPSPSCTPPTTSAKAKPSHFNFWEATHVKLLHEPRGKSFSQANHNNETDGNRSLSAMDRRQSRGRSQSDECDVWRDQLSDCELSDNESLSHQCTSAAATAAAAAAAARASVNAPKSCATETAAAPSTSFATAAALDDGDGFSLYQSVRLFIGVSGPYDLFSLCAHLHERGLDSSILHWIARRNLRMYSPTQQLMAFVRHGGLPSSPLPSIRKTGFAALNAGSTTNVVDNSTSDSQSVSEKLRSWGVLAFQALFTESSVLHHEDPLDPVSPLSVSEEEPPSGRLMSQLTPESGSALKDFTPTAFIHGSADRSVPVAQCTNLAALLRDEGARVSLHVYQGWSHTDAILEAPLAGNTKLFHDVRQLTMRYTDSASSDDSRQDQFTNGLRVEREEQEIERSFVPEPLLRIARAVNPF